MLVWSRQLLEFCLRDNGRGLDERQLWKLPLEVSVAFGLNFALARALTDFVYAIDHIHALCMCAYMCVCGNTRQFKCENMYV